MKPTSSPVFVLAFVAAVAACVDRPGGVTGTQSLDVSLVAPTDPGAVDRRLADGLPSVTVDLTALDERGAFDPSFDRDVEVYVQYLGTLTPDLNPQAPTRPLVTLHVTAGKALNQSIPLPAVFGPTAVWFEDGKKFKPGGDVEDTSYQPSYVTGASPMLWFRDPYIADLQRPKSESAATALTDSPLAGKQVTVRASRYGEVGRLVVTSVFSQGYTVSDVRCADAAGTPPCVAQAYDHMVVFSFSAPRDQQGQLLREGQVIDGFAGGVSDFNGLTEIGFPVSYATDNAVTPDRRPVPVVLNPATWFQPLGNAEGMINFERNEAAAIEVRNGRVCALDKDYTTFKQWKVDPNGVGGDCSGNRNVLNVITAGVIGDLDPATLVGKVIPRVVGIVRPVEIGTFNVWIIFPRSAADLTLP